MTPIGLGGIDRPAAAQRLAAADGKLRDALA